MLHIKNAEQLLRKQIGEHTDPAKVWEIFKEFSLLDAENEDEKAILFQCGIFNFTGEALFYYDFVRQFAGEEGGELEQLHCEFVFEPVQELKDLEAETWYFDSEGDIEDFFKEVESLKEFQKPLRYKPVELNIYQEQT